MSDFDDAVAWARLRAGIEAEQRADARAADSEHLAEVRTKYAQARSSLVEAWSRVHVAIANASPRVDALLEAPEIHDAYRLALASKKRGLLRAKRLRRSEDDEIRDRYRFGAWLIDDHHQLSLGRTNNSSGHSFRAMLAADARIYCIDRYGPEPSGPDVLISRFVEIFAKDEDFTKRMHPDDLLYNCHQLKHGFASLVLRFDLKI